MAGIEPILLAGIDEAGRGPLAGPLVVAAVILDPMRRINGLADSKALTARRRELLYGRICERAAAYHWEIVDVLYIEQHNIFQATMHGMRQAAAGLSLRPLHALIDGKHVPKDMSMTAEAIVGGDALVPAISAASILAKVVRDRIMHEYESAYPLYGFAKHKGYGTKAHLAALKDHGPCAIHRKTFLPVKALLPSLFA